MCYRRPVFTVNKYGDVSDRLIIVNIISRFNLEIEDTSVCMCVCVCARARAYMSVCVYVCACMPLCKVEQGTASSCLKSLISGGNTHTHTHTHARTHPHKHTTARVHLHTDQCTQMHTHIHVRTQTTARARAHTHAHTHTHTHVPPEIIWMKPKYSILCVGRELGPKRRKNSFVYIIMFCCTVFQLIGATWHPILSGPLQVEEVSVRLITVSVRLNTVNVRLNTVSVKLNTATKRENTDKQLCNFPLYWNLIKTTTKLLPPNVCAYTYRK